MIKNTHHLPGVSLDKLNIYIGIARSNKGWSEVCESVRSMHPDAYIWLSSPIKSPAFTPEEFKLIQNLNICVQYFPSSEDLFKFFPSVDIAIFNSKFMEGWNRTLVQLAMASNAVIFAKSIGGMKDVAEYCPWISLYNDYSHLQSYLYWNCRTNEQLKTAKAFVLSQKSSHSNLTSEKLSFSNFSKKWLLLLGHLK